MTFTSLYRVKVNWKLNLQVKGVKFYIQWLIILRVDSLGSSNRDNRLRTDISRLIKSVYKFLNVREYIVKLMKISFKRTYILYIIII